MPVDLSRRRLNISYNVRRVGVVELGPVFRSLDVIPDVNYVFVCTGDGGVFAIDVSDPRRPHVAGTWGWWDEGWLPARMKIVGDLAYVVGMTPGVAPGFRIIDISRPIHPREIGYCAGDGIFGMEPFHWDIAIAGKRAYVTFGGSVLWVLDISNPAAPVEECDIIMSTRTSGVVIQEHNAYVVADGLQVLDVLDPVHPYTIGIYSITRPRNAVPPGPFPGMGPMCRQLNVSGNRAYVTDDKGSYHIVDISRPSKLVRLGVIPAPTGVKDVDLAVSGDFAFVLELARHGHLTVLDVTDPAHLAAGGFRDIPVPCHCLGLSGQFAYVAGFNHFGIYDCSAAMVKR